MAVAMAFYSPSGLLRRHHNLDLFVLGIGQPRHGKAESGDHLLLATDTRLQGFRGFHARKDRRFSFSCTANCAPTLDFLRVCYSHTFPLVHLTQSWSRPKNFVGPLYSCKNKMLW